MSSYKYDNGIYIIETPIYSGYRRFHSMCAQVKVTHKVDRCGEYHIVHSFISYNTPVIQVDYYPNTQTYYIDVNSDYANFSRSTSRQVSRFIFELNVPCGVNAAIKKACKAAGIYPIEADGKTATVYAWNDRAFREIYAEGVNK